MDELSNIIISRGQKVNTQLVLMFLAQNIIVEILIKIFISLMHKLAIRKRRPNYNDDLKVLFFYEDSNLTSLS